MANCRLCRGDAIHEWLDFGPQTLSNRFLHSQAEAEYRHPCKLGVCRACGTIQLESPVPAAEMKPRFDWINDTAPEGHLDEVAGVLAKLPGVTKQSTIGGISHQDESTLERLNDLGFSKTWLGVERAAKHGRPDLLVVRHALERSHDIHELLDSTRRLVQPNGHVLFEIPDARKALERHDYTLVWDEHLFYFTPATLRQAFAQAGFEISYLNRFYYSQEDMLVAIVKPSTQPQTTTITERELAFEVDRGDRFVRAFPRYRERLMGTIAGFRGKVAMLGAGHVSSAYINLYGLEDSIDCVADGNAKAHGLFMPGSKTPIVPLNDLVKRNIGLCLMSAPTEIEDAVAAKLAAFTARGGVLTSIFPESKFSLNKLNSVRSMAA